MENVRRLVKLAPSEGASRSIHIVCSTIAEDRHGDTIDPKGWKLDNYRANPVLLWGHDMYAPPIGRALSIGVNGASLEGQYEFAPAGVYPLADTVYALAKNGFINAGSVGFKPIKYQFRTDSDGVDFLEQELLEMSIVSVPSNPEALISARSKGIDFRPIVAVTPKGTLRDALEAFVTAPTDKHAETVAASAAAYQIAKLRSAANMNALRLI